jgi:hypothetical protein
VRYILFFLLAIRRWPLQSVAFVAVWFVVGYLAPASLKFWVLPAAILTALVLVGVWATADTPKSKAAAGPDPQQTYEEVERRWRAGTITRAEAFPLLYRQRGRYDRPDAERQLLDEIIAAPLDGEDAARAAERAANPPKPLWVPSERAQSMTYEEAVDIFLRGSSAQTDESPGMQAHTDARARLEGSDEPVPAEEIAWAAKRYGRAYRDGITWREYLMKPSEARSASS